MSDKGKWLDNESEYLPIEVSLDCSQPSEFGPADAMGFCVEGPKIALFMTRDAAIILRNKLTESIEAPNGLRR